jgi:hypothetical protein
MKQMKKSSNWSMARTVRYPGAAGDGRRIVVAPLLLQIQQLPLPAFGQASPPLLDNNNSKSPIRQVAPKLW